MQSLPPVLLVLALFLSHVNALYFYLDGSKQKCFYEELPAETTVVGNYRSEELNEAGQFVSNPVRGLQINVETESHVRVLSLRGKNEGRFVFSTAESGEYSICLFTVSPGWFSTATKTRLYLELVFGEARHDDPSDMKKEALTDLGIQIRALSTKVANVRREQEYQREREAEFRNASEAANSHVQNWTILQLVVLSGTCVWQLRYLRNFFVAKKLV
ncbi:emp24/gp25L/p24 family/GOLD-domain-containing protein [Powellomyces hirtus]|nr:emp24/gp25L/p24 family/GOLD-domain-containing protein [Powellomyces hirtus]